MKNMALIPARGGSKGIPGKNIKQIAGKPLIAWSIEQALAAKHIDRVIVSTDCLKTVEIATRYGAEVPFVRPSELASDTATTESAMSHALEWMNSKENYYPDNIVLLQATSPIRHARAIDEAVEKFVECSADSLLSVCEHWHFLWENKEAPAALYDYKNRPRRQDIKPEQIKYRENGSIYISNSDLFKANNNRLFGKIAMYIMDEMESFEIDTDSEWNLIELLMTNR